MTRSGRSREVGFKTLPARMPKKYLAMLREVNDGTFEQLVDDGVDVERPKTRGECAGGARPCPFVSCRHHLYLDVTAAGALKLNFPDAEVEKIPASCSLDIADAGGVTLGRVGDLMNLTRERVRQLELLGEKSARAFDEEDGELEELVEDLGELEASRRDPDVYAIPWLDAATASSERAEQRQATAKAVEA